MSAAVDRTLRTILEDKGLPVGTTLENKVTWRLHRWGILDQCQYRVGRYRLDYAWPAKLIALEADGPHHWRPDVAMKDAVRDSWLRARGWFVFRVDDSGGALEEQLGRVARVVNCESLCTGTLRRGGAPPGDSPRPASGGSTAPSKSELIKAARIAELDGGDHAA
jgi:very-short-patch-repair endonuclease